MANIFVEREAVLNAIHALHRKGYAHPGRDQVAMACGLDKTTTLNATKWLRDRDFIDGTGAADGFLFVMHITPYGEDAVDSGASLKDLTSPRGQSHTRGDVHITNNTSGGPLNQQVGDHNQQQINIGVSPDDIAELIAALKEAGHEDLAAEVATATDNGRAPGKVGKALTTVIPALTAAGELAGAAQIIAGFF
ncbi:hypothetical protein PQI66_09875 [Corynebacterium sp. USCH3]|uniref:hypothetical protein n=1 Tax=Corynebacterium sp. USCH3 TaxID=3024840 RepID=UPI0030A6932D